MRRYSVRVAGSEGKTMPGFDWKENEEDGRVVAERGRIWQPMPVPESFGYTPDGVWIIVVFDEIDEEHGRMARFPPWVADS